MPRSKHCKTCRCGTGDRDIVSTLIKKRALLTRSQYELYSVLLPRTHVSHARVPHATMRET